MKTLLLILLLLSALQVQAQEPSYETVVEDMIFNSSSRVVIDEKTIKESRTPNLISLISTQANITVTNSAFQPNSIFIRGGDSSHVMILVDGVPFYDASTVQRTFNLNSVDIRTVKRVEIIKGSQTVLYGGQALSGVIKIDTIPQEFATRTGLVVQGGTQNTREASVSHAQAIGDNQLALVRAFGGWKEAESPVLNSSKTYPRQNSSADATYAWKGDFEGYLKASYLQDYNFAGSSSFVTFQVTDADDFTTASRSLGVSSVLKLNNVYASPRLSFGIQNGTRNFDQPPAPPFPVTNQDYGSNLRTVRLDTTPFKNDIAQLMVGLNYSYEDFMYHDGGVERANRSSEQRGVYAKVDVQSQENLLVSFGLRHENWASQDGVSTGQLGLTFFKNTKFEVSNAYKIPSLFQLYSSYGNPDLEEERAIQYSLTQDVNLTDRQRLSLTVFVSEFSNLITTTGTGLNLRFNNVNKAESRGAELSYSLKPDETSALFMTVGYQEPKDKTTGAWLPRRPLVNGSVRYTQYWDKHTGTLEIQGAGERTDRTGQTTSGTVPGYAIGNASYSYAFNEGASGYLRVNNLLDYRYQETYTYYTEGISALAGAEFWF